MGQAHTRMNDEPIASPLQDIVSPHHPFSRHPAMVRSIGNCFGSKNSEGHSFLTGAVPRSAASLRNLHRPVAPSHVDSCRPDSHTRRAQSKLDLLVFDAESGLIVLDSAEIKCRKARLDFPSSRAIFAKLGLTGHQAEQLLSSSA